MSELTPRDETTAHYLDGLLEGEALRAFEDALAGDPELRAAVEADRRMVSSLRSLFEPPAVGSATAVGPTVSASTEAPTSPRRINGWLRFSALAAAVVITLVLAIAYTSHQSRTSPFAAPQVEPAVLYRTALDRGFQPAWVCEDDAQMLDFTRQRFRRGLLFTPVKGVELVGWGYAAGALSETSATVLAKQGEHRIVLIVDRSRNDRALEDPSLADASLRMFRRVVGRFVLYEITPLARPVLLDAAYMVDPDITLKPGEPGPGPNGRTQQ